MKAKIYKFGERTKDIWSGDIVTICEFIMTLPNQRLLFYDIDCKIFRSCFWQVIQGGFVLNGWDCTGTIKDLISK